MLARLINIKKQYDDHLIYYSVITYDGIIYTTETVWINSYDKEKHEMNYCILNTFLITTILFLKTVIICYYFVQHWLKRTLYHIINIKTERNKEFLEIVLKIAHVLILMTWSKLMIFIKITLLNEESCKNYNLWCCIQNCKV